LIAVDRHGRIAMPYSSAGMYRAAADSRGRDEVRIWEE
jgi:isoaspartyl peptidase/L-asparaginase-like protein (Ntn-hydrolase superfamily)